MFLGRGDLVAELKREHCVGHAAKCKRRPKQHATKPLVGCPEPNME